MNEDRGSWYLLTAILLGLGLGLLYSWVISPAEYVDTPPFSLRGDYKDQYRAVIAAAYVASGDLPRAQARLNLLQDEDPSLALVAQAQRFLAEGQNVQDAQALADLASALGQAPTPFPTQPEDTATSLPTATPTVESSPTATPSPTIQASATFTPPAESETPLPTAATATQDGTLRPTLTPSLTPTPRATLTPSLSPTPTSSQTPTATLAPPFVLDNQVLVCNPQLSEPQIQVFVSNAAGVGIPGVEVIVTWNGGEEHFFTGLKPDIDIGYADFVMTPQTTYALQVGEGGQVISSLTAPECAADSGEAYWGSWRLVFSHP